MKIELKKLIKLELSNRNKYERFARTVNDKIFYYSYKRLLYIFFKSLIYVNKDIHYDLRSQKELNLSNAIKRTNVIFSSGSLIDVCDLLYFLIHFKSRFSKFIFLSIIKNTLIYLLHRKILNYLQRSESIKIYIDQDFHGGESILVSYSTFIDFTLIYYQHGLLKFEEITRTKLYPGYRCTNQVVFNSEYKKIFMDFCKYPIKTQFVLNDFQKELNIKDSTPPRFIIVGSPEITENVHLQHKISMIIESLKELSFQVIFRPHPSENFDYVKSKLQFNRKIIIRIDESDKPGCANLKSIYVGNFSTMLFMAKIYGYKYKMIDEFIYQREMSTK